MQIIVNNKEIEEIKAMQQEILSRLGQSKQEDELISLGAAESIVNVEQQKLRQMFLSGELPGKRFGKAIRISRSALLNVNKD